RGGQRGVSGRPVIGKYSVHVGGLEAGIGDRIANGLNPQRTGCPIRSAHVGRLTHPHYGIPVSQRSFSTGDSGSHVALSQSGLAAMASSAVLTTLPLVLRGKAAASTNRTSRGRLYLASSPSSIARTSPWVSVAQLATTKTTG